MGNNFSDRIDLIKRIVSGIALIMLAGLATVGFMYLISTDQLHRDIHNTAACDETCAMMELRNMNQPDACWCGDDLHSDHVIPLAWEFKKGEVTPTVKTVELDVGN